MGELLYGTQVIRPTDLGHLVLVLCVHLRQLMLQVLHVRAMEAQVGEQRRALLNREYHGRPAVGWVGLQQLIDFQRVFVALRHSLSDAELVESASPLVES
jgi:hypothetical protein